MSENGKIIFNYHYIKQRFNHFVNEELSYDCQNKMKNNHLNMITNRWSSRSHSNTVFSNQNNNFNNTELNLNNVLNTLCNQCESLNHKGIDCSYKNKICDYCKRKEHLQKACYKKKYDDRINSITTDKKDDSDHAFINTFIISEEFHKNWLTRHDSDRICLLQESHYIFIIIINSETICHTFYNKIIFKSIKLTI